MKNFGRKMLGLVLTISMVCTILPVAVTAKSYVASAWIEGEDLLSSSYTEGGTRNYGCYSGGKAQCVDTTDEPVTDDGYYFDYEVDLEAGAYDIYFRGADYEYDDWMSDATAYVDGEEKSYENIMDEYEDFDTDTDGFTYAWMKVSSVEFTEDGTHTIRWAYLSKSEAGGYYGVLDCMVIVPSNLSFTPVENDIAKTKQEYSKLFPNPEDYVANAWIEAENNSAGSFNNQPIRTEFSGGKAAQLTTQSAPANSKDGYYLDFNVFLQEGAYDIYFRGACDAFNGDWMSKATAYVDGDKMEYTKVLDEGWGDSFSSPLGNYAHGWVKVSNVTLSKDAHTLRWAYLSKAKSNPSWYIGGLDCIVVLPSGASFKPTKNNPANTKLDYEISLLLADYNLLSLAENITLPSKLEDETAVTWVSSNTDVIANDGTVTRPETSSVSVTLTATVGAYSKEFNVIVRGYPATNAWIEGEDDLLSGSYTANGTRNLECYSGGKAQFVNTNAIPGADGYFFDHIVNLQAGTYDIYFRGSDDAFNADWMSNATAYIDGVEIEYQTLLSEGWDGEGGCAYGWLKAASLELTDDIHTIRWAYETPRKSSTPQYIGAIDVIIILPSSAPFKPTAKDLVATKADYNMCTLLNGYNLSNITDNIIFPTELVDGTAVTWTSSNTDIIANDGTVKRPVGKDLKVTLVATTADNREISFIATVKGVEATVQPIGGTLTSGGTVTASATVTSNGNTSGKANLILAIYRPDKTLLDGTIVKGEMIKGAVDIDEKVIATTSTTFDCTVTIGSGITGDLLAKAFVLGEDIQPLTDEITLAN